VCFWYTVPPSGTDAPRGVGARELLAEAAAEALALALRLVAAFFTPLPFTALGFARSGFGASAAAEGGGAIEGKR
jgi:hypothetical protein